MTRIDRLHARPRDRGSSACRSATARSGRCSTAIRRSPSSASTTRPRGRARPAASSRRCDRRSDAARRSSGPRARRDRRGRSARREAALRPMQVPWSQAYLPFATVVLTRDGGEHRTAASRRRRTGGRSTSARGCTSLAARCESGRSSRRCTASSYTASRGTRDLRPRIRDSARGSRSRAAARTRGGLLIRLPSDVAPGHEPDRPGCHLVGGAGRCARGRRRRRHRGGRGRDAGGRRDRDDLRPPRCERRDGCARRIRARRRQGAGQRSGRLGRHCSSAHLDDWMPRFGRARIALGRRAVRRIRRAARDSRASRARRLRTGWSRSPQTRRSWRCCSISAATCSLASSRPGSLPATLQGIWNDELRPPWSSNYTLNINTRDELLGGALDGARRMRRAAAGTSSRRSPCAGARRRVVSTAPEAGSRITIRMPGR